MQQQNGACQWKDCKFISNSVQNLFEHCLEHFEATPQNGKFVCNWKLCDFRCDRFYGLKSHISKHIPFTPFVCPVCSRQFKRKYDCKKHMKHVHYKGIDESLLHDSVINKKDNS